MANKEVYIEKTREFITPILENKGFELYDIEYVKEGQDYFLRVYIEKPGGITIDDCVEVSREMNEILDREDYIKDAYTFEVSSPGLLRPFKIDKDYERALNEDVEIHTFKPVDKQKEFIGTLKSYDKDSVTVEIDGEEKTFTKKGISLIRKYIEF
ncbi:MAG: ribosome maturation factor RimP [Lachnospiraceae bacterium]|nr:ribosome maturation factor RimP [Lachnospiraceae bacterium]